MNSLIAKQIARIPRLGGLGTREAQRLLFADRHDEDVGRARGAHQGYVVDGDHCGLRVSCASRVGADGGSVRRNAVRLGGGGGLADKVTPYGTIYFNLFDNSAGTNNADVPLWATPGTANLSASGRQTRFGVRVTGLTYAQAKVTGVVEADFYGGFPSVGVGDNMGIVRLRLANVRLDWQKTSLVVGQDWAVFAPENPVSIASAGIPLMAADGNPWARLPQVRVEWHDSAELLQGALLAPSTGDFSSAYLDVPASGQLSQLPFLQGRVAFRSTNSHPIAADRAGGPGSHPIAHKTRAGGPSSHPIAHKTRAGGPGWRGLKRPASIGVSGQYGRARVITTTADRTIDAWARARLERAARESPVDRW